MRYVKSIFIGLLLLTALQLSFHHQGNVIHKTDVEDQTIMAYKADLPGEEKLWMPIIDYSGYLLFLPVLGALCLVILKAKSDKKIQKHFLLPYFYQTNNL